MKIENGKVVSATENELFRLYLNSGLEDAMDFYEYKARMQEAGCEVNKNT